MKEIGKLGERLVSLWLETQNYQILARNWSCRWGEIDLVVLELPSNTLAFVEVKTRGKRNWDRDGKQAIDFAKQAKLSTTAALFLAEHPQLAELPCRFDVALVSYQKIVPAINNPRTTIAIGLPIALSDKYEFILQEYLVAAFDVA